MDIGAFSGTSSNPKCAEENIFEKRRKSANLLAMWNRSAWPIFLVVIPLALITGYLLATPNDFISFGAVGLLLFALCIPLLLRWHYPILIFSWNATVMLFFLPGYPFLWMFMAFLSLGISVLQRTVNRETAFLKAPSVTLPLLFLGAVVFVTAKLTGGIGVAALGSSSYGGKKYFYVLAAIVGYFALIAQPIPVERAKRYATIFFLSGLTAIFSNLVYYGGPGFFFLYRFFPAEFAFGQAMSDLGMQGHEVIRITGLHFAGLAMFCALLIQGSLRDFFDWRQPWKFLLFVGTAFVSLLSGFRSLVVIFGLIFVALFCLQRLYRTSLLPKLLLAGVLGFALLLPFVSKLPFSVQRALSVLPIEVSAAARADAEGSSEWRLQMWRVLVQQIPQYFFLGKGYGIDPTELYLTEQKILQGLAGSNEEAMIAGDYHSGPLSLIIPFGIFGVIGFVWFIIAGLHALYRNYRYGDPSLQYINSFLLAYFLAKTIFYFAVFGSLHSDLFMFVGLVGLSISLNRGIKQEPAAASQLTTQNTALIPA
jgi:O-antigen ligase